MTAPADENDHPLFDRFTLFFDFLGSSTATSWPKKRLYPFLDLLIAIAAQMQSAQDIDGSPQEDGSYRWQSIEDAAPRLSVEVTAGGVHNAAEIESVVSSFAVRQNSGLISLPHALTNANHNLILALELRHRAPTVFGGSAGS